MYLDNSDFHTVWKLAHNWTGLPLDGTDPANVPTPLREAVHRLLHAIVLGEISVRTRSRVIFAENSFINNLIDLPWIFRFRKCLRRNSFDTKLLDNLYVKRAEIISWCEKNYLPIPPIWDLQNSKKPTVDDYDPSDDDNSSWYNDLTDRRKARIACLELAKKLWLANPNQTYEQVYENPTMKQFGNPGVFSFEAFRKWSRPFASEFAKAAGRRKESDL